MKNKLAIFAAIAVLITGIACSSDETEKANQSVSEANKFVTDANSAATEATGKGSEYDKKVAAIENDSDLEEVRDYGRDLIKIYSSMEENFKKAGDKFDEASKFKVADQFREYLQTKAQEMKKRSEYSAELKKIPNALIESKSKGKYTDAVAELVPKIQKMTKEAQELGDKADKLVKDNPTLIKKN